MLGKIINLFKEKKKYDYPHEFFIIKFSENAKKDAIFDDTTKIIEYYKGSIIRTYPYTEEFVEVFNEIEGVPYFDETTEEFKIQIEKKINPALLTYEQEVN